MVRFACQTNIAAPAALVFDLSLNIDAHLGSMRGFGEHAIGGVTTGQFGPGQQVTWRAAYLKTASRGVSHLTLPADTT